MRDKAFFPFDAEDDAFASLAYIDQIAERRIADAIKRGEFEHLPGAGKPLSLDDAPLVPEDLRMAYHVLKNAGYVPPELELHREIHELEDMLHALCESAEKTRMVQRLALLRTRLGESRGRALEHSGYRARVGALLHKPFGKS